MGRWTDYFVEKDFDGFWKERIAESGVRLLTILGIGFDPRCLTALKLISDLRREKQLGYIALKLIARPAIGTSGIVTERLAKQNLDNLQSLSGCKKEAIYDIDMHDEEGHNVVGRKTLSVIGGTTDVFSQYTDILLDISGMPRGVFFPLLAYLIRLLDRGVFNNLHVSVVEDPLLDSKITGREYGQADYLHTFRYQGGDKLIWLPLLGTNEGARLEKIHNKIKNACVEICPILPFPARSLRRADEIAVKHSDLLFEGLMVSPDNVLLCDERNAFDVYRKILEVEEYYRQRLSAIHAIGRVTTVVSPLSSKTLSLGMLLAAIERSLPVCHVEAGTYDVDVDAQGNLIGDIKCSPIEMWLGGEPYIS